MSKQNKTAVSDTSRELKHAPVEPATLYLRVEAHGAVTEQELSGMMRLAAEVISSERRHVGKVEYGDFNEKGLSWTVGVETKK
jgi:hypothetical protein